MRGWVGIVFAAGVTLAAVLSVSVVQARGLPTSVTSPVDTAIGEAMAEIQRDIDDGDYAAASKALDRVTNLPSFKEAPRELRHGVWLMLAGSSSEARDWPKARAAIAQAVAFQDANGFDWQTRVMIARRSGDMADGIKSLTVLAQRFPDSLAAYADEDLLRWMEQAKLAPDRDAAFALADALVEHWKPKDPFGDLSAVRVIQVEGLLQAGQTAKAVASTRRIDNPDALIAMRADKRYDALAAIDPALMNPKPAAVRQLARVDPLRATYPRLLSGVALRAGALLDLDRGEDALTFIEPLIAQAQKDPDSFDDTDAKLAWTINVKNHALQALGRADEALEAIQTAARIPERGHPNVNQTLNLAAELMESGRAKAALATVASVRQDRVSPYGESVALRITTCAATDLGDLLAADAALRRLRELKLEGARQMEAALLCRGDLDGAAVLLIERLRDPIQRNPALYALQVTPPTDTLTPLQIVHRERSAALRARPDVKAAIDAVGRIYVYSADDLWPAKSAKTAKSSMR